VFYVVLDENERRAVLKALQQHERDLEDRISVCGNNETIRIMLKELKEVQRAVVKVLNADEVWVKANDNKKETV